MTHLDLIALSLTFASAIATLAALLREAFEA